MALSTTGYNIVGAGNALDNGLASPAGNDSAGNAYFALPNGRTLYYCGQGSQFNPQAYLWVITNIVPKPTASGASTAGTDFFVVGTSDPTNLPLTGWQVVSAGGPAPTLTAATGGGGGTAPTTPPSASTLASNTLTTPGPVPANAAFLDIFRGTTAGGEAATAIGSVSVVGGATTATTYNDTSVVAGTVYFYKTAWRNSVGSGPQSAEVSGTAAAPTQSPPSTVTGPPSNIASATPNAQPGAATNLIATAGDKRVLLQWNNPATGISSVSVQRRITAQKNAAANAWTTITTLAATTPGNPATVPASYLDQDSALVNGTTYDYEVYLNP